MTDVESIAQYQSGGVQRLEALHFGMLIMMPVVARELYLLWKTY